ncbi:MAG: cupredoxin domain-containing protein [Actinomycetota bacterium]|nr:cupredoxin domain-containing protein [Actinomycetota bacterium]HSH23556.1 cupredoxin domain-containing protein [Acidimicrobiales bacterium]
MKRIPVVLVVAIALLVGGCGDDEEEPVATGTAPERAAEEASEPPVQLQGQVNERGQGQLFDDTLAVELGNFYFEPTYVQAAQAAVATVNLKNESDASHTFTIESLQIDQEVRPGESKDVQVQLPTTGDVEFFCRFHKDQGMRGVFYFQASG